MSDFIHIFSVVSIPPAVNENFKIQINLSGWMAWGEEMKWRYIQVSLSGVHRYSKEFEIWKLLVNPFRQKYVPNVIYT